MPKGKTLPKVKALELIRLIALGWTNRRIGTELGYGEQVIKNKIHKVSKTLNYTSDPALNNRVMIARWYWENHERAR